MEVEEAAVIHFSRSVSKHNFCYTTLVSYGQCHLHCTCARKCLRTSPHSKEECLNYVQKWMGIALYNLAQKSDKA